MEMNLMNEMIDYIENHLTEAISYQKLSKIVGMNEFLMQRVFSIITGISISEYIRKRRLSKALEEIKNSNQTILDIAIKYQYSSSIAFARAFKKEYGKSPNQYRKGNEKYSQFLKLHFERLNFDNQRLEYEIRENEEMILWVKRIEAEKLDILHDKIRKFYKILHSTEEYKQWNKTGMYAILEAKKNKYLYFVGSTKKFPNTEKKIIQAGKYAIFSVGSREQKEIVQMGRKIHRRWASSTNFSLKNDMVLEFYQQENCYIEVPIQI